jgi:hypothetical protein
MFKGRKLSECMPAALEQLTALLRAKQLDRTLSSFPAPIERVAFGIPELDGPLQGGLPRGQLSELIGPRSSGRTSVMHAILAAATKRGELSALVDTLDTFDPPSAASAQIDLQHLLWVRGPSLAHIQGSQGSQGSLGSRGSHDLLLSAVERAVKAFNLILQAGRFAVVVLDLADVPMPIVRRLPFTTWLRLQRVLEKSDPAGLLLAEDHIGRSARGFTVQLSRPVQASLHQPSPWETPSLRYQVSAVTSRITKITKGHEDHEGHEETPRVLRECSS